MAKIKVALIKCLTIPRLELSGTLVLARMIHVNYVAKVLQIASGKSIPGQIAWSCWPGYSQTLIFSRPL